MATVNAKIYEHYKKADGTHNVKIASITKIKESFLIPHIMSSINN